jgi:hypothetical protein
MSQSSREYPYGCRVKRSWTLKVIVRSLPVRQLYDASMDKIAWCRLYTAPFSVLHSFILVARQWLLSLGAPTGRQTCGPLQWLGN